MPPVSPEQAQPPLLRDPLHHAALPPRQGLQGDGYQGCEPLRHEDSEASPAWRQCVRMRELRTGTVRAALSLVHRKPGNCALTRAAAWTSVLPGPARDHHGPEDPVEEAGHRDDQDQDAGTKEAAKGSSVIATKLIPGRGNEVCIKCIVDLSFQYYCTKCLSRLKETLQSPFPRRCSLICWLMPVHSISSTRRGQMWSG